MSDCAPKPMMSVTTPTLASEAVTSTPSARSPKKTESSTAV